MVRVYRRVGETLVDLAVLTAAYTLGFLLRFDWDPPWSAIRQWVFTLPYAVVLKYLFLYALGVPRFPWRFVGLREAMRIVVGLGLGTTVLLAVRLGTGMLHHDYPALRRGLIPLGVLAIDFSLACIAVVGVRVARRIRAERATQATHRKTTPGESIPTLVVGAGQAGLMVAKEIEKRPDLGIKPVGFVDDDILKHGTILHGIRVLGSTEELPALCERTGAKQVLIAVAAAPGSVIRRFSARCEAAGVPAKMIPGLYEMVDGRAKISRIRDVAIEDLLRRDPVVLDEDAISKVVRDRVVLVSGAGGSIGSELCRQIVRFGPKRLLLLERAENSLFFVHRELTQRHADVEIIPLVADVADSERLRAIFGDERPEVVFHAAAHKHVPMMEWNPGEAVKNNVLGTKAIADVSHAFGVSAFVMISTDKAVNPTSVMGATKRMAELYIQALSERSETRFTAVRFGNVLDSAGSVVPIFRDQIKRGGPVTVTHPEMCRYFMTIPEACQLVLQAGSMGTGGEIFILDMGEPVKIVDLARDLISLSGLKPDHDIDIVFSGIRPGEKLFEELSVQAENAAKTRHPKIFVGKLQPSAWDSLQAQLNALGAAYQTNQQHDIRSALKHAVPEYALPEREPPKRANTDKAASRRSSDARRPETGGAPMLPLRPAAHRN